MPSKVRKSIVVGHDPITGKAILKTFNGKTKKEVNEAMDKFKIEATTGVKNEPDEITTFDAWADRWIYLYKSGEVESTTYNCYQFAIKHLTEKFKGYPINLITPIQMQEFFKSKSNMSQSSLQLFKVTANMIFQSAIDNGLAFTNPVKSIRKPKGKKAKKKRVYTLDEAKIVKEFAKNHPDGLGIYIILSTGIRRGELMGIKPLEDMDFQNNRIKIQRVVQEVRGHITIKDELKNHDDMRTIPLSEQDAEYFNSRKEFHQKGFLFQARNTKKDKPKSPSNWACRDMERFYNDLDSELKSKGMEPIDHLNPHELRHTYGTLLFKSGTDIYALQKIMGHKSIEVTMGIYVHGDVSDVENRVQFPEF